MIKVTISHLRYAGERELPEENEKSFAELVRWSLLVPGTVVEIRFADGSRFKAVNE